MSKYKKNLDVSYRKIIDRGGNGFILAFSVIGDHDINQDSYKFKIDNDVIKLALADGLGSSKFSDIGADVVTQTALDNDCKVNPEESFLKLFNDWKNRIGNMNLFDYDTTLKCINVYDYEIDFFNIGDGITYIETDEDKYLFLTNNEFLTETDSICSFKSNRSDYYKNIKYQNRVVVITYTDGIDQFLNRDKISDFANELIQMFKDDDASIKDEIESWIKTWDNKKYYDDKTMLVLYFERS